MNLGVCGGVIYYYFVKYQVQQYSQDQIIPTSLAQLVVVVNTLLQLDSPLLKYQTYQSSNNNGDNSFCSVELLYQLLQQLLVDKSTFRNSNWSFGKSSTAAATVVSVVSKIKKLATPARLVRLFYQLLTAGRQRTCVGHLNSLISC